MKGHMVLIQMKRTIARLAEMETQSRIKDKVSTEEILAVLLEIKRMAVEQRKNKTIA